MVMQMDPDHHVRVVNCQCIPVCFTNQGAVLRHPMSSWIIDGRLHTVRSAIYVSRQSLIDQ